MLGQLAAEAAWSRAGERHGGEGRQYGKYFVPGPPLLYAAQVLTQQLYPQFINTLRELAGGGMIMLPSSSATSPTRRSRAHRQDAEVAGGDRGRVKFFKLAWDAVGSEFGRATRNTRCSTRAPRSSTRGHCFRTYEWDKALGLVDRFMESYDLPQAPAKAPPRTSGRAG